MRNESCRFVYFCRFLKVALKVYLDFLGKRRRKKLAKQKILLMPVVILENKINVVVVSNST